MPLVSAAGAVGSYLPSNITDIWEPQRHFAFAKIPSSSQANTILNQNTTSSISSATSSSIKDKDRITICSFGAGERPLLSVLTSDGSFYTFSISSEGGECSLIKTDSILTEEEE